MQDVPTSYDLGRDSGPRWRRTDTSGLSEVNPTWPHYLGYYQHVYATVAKGCISIASLLANMV